MAANTDIMVALLREFKSITELTDIGAVIERFQYAGFKPEQIIGEIYKRGGNNFNWNDIMTMIVLYHVRGANIAKMQGKMSEAGKTTVSKLAGTYGLVSKGKESATAITLPRVAQCFPWLSVQFVMAYPDIGPISLSNMTSEVNNFPRCAMTPAINALIPKQATTTWSEEDRSNMMLVCRWYQMKLTELVGTSGKTGRKAWDETDTYVKAAVVSSYPTQQIRIDRLTGLGISPIMFKEPASIIRSKIAMM